MSIDSTTGISPIGHWAGCFRRFATFSGRARRAEYWSFTLISLAIYLVLLVADQAVDMPGADLVISVLSIGFVVVAYVPTLAVTCRRLHDSGRSGWFQLLNLVPFGFVVVLIFTLSESEPGPNRWGPEPR